VIRDGPAILSKGADSASRRGRGIVYEYELDLVIDNTKTLNLVTNGIKSELTRVSFWSDHRQLYIIITLSMSSRYQDRDRDEGRYSREEPDRKDRGEDRRRKYEPEEETDRSPRRDRDADRERDRARPTDRARSRSPKREPGSSRYDGKLLIFPC
jgi:hypothetical protein